jgi:hypothetical protein
MTNRERSADFAARAEKLLNDSGKSGNAPVRGREAAQGTGYATLAVYFQREADREEGR